MRTLTPRGVPGGPRVVPGKGLSGNLAPIEFGIHNIELPAGLGDVDTQVGNLMTGGRRLELLQDISVGIARIDVASLKFGVIGDGDPWVEVEDEVAHLLELEGGRVSGGSRVDLARFLLLGRLKREESEDPGNYCQDDEWPNAREEPAICLCELSRELWIDLAPKTSDHRRGLGKGLFGIAAVEVR